jgi:AcrR family transcriptional regulator
MRLLQRKTWRKENRTRTAGFDALFSLIHDKAYDAISVKEILDRANVGRSTFYTHFRDKDELLFSGMRDLLGAVQSAPRPSSANHHERIIGFSLPVFEHIYEHHRTGTVKMGAKGRAVLHGHLQKVLAEMIADNLGKNVQGRRKKAGQVSPELLVRHVPYSADIG